MAYNSPYQPTPNASEMKRLGMRAGQNVLEKTIIFSAQLAKFVIQFVMDALKQVTGR